MQRPKEEIRSRILDAARVCFLRQGYVRTSMRDIAEESAVGLGNIYNYFSGKDDLLCRVLQPLVDTLHQMLHRHHGQQADPRLMGSERYYRECLHEYVALIERHRDLMRILFFRTQGSSMEDFVDRFSDRATQLSMEWLGRNRQLHPESATEVSGFTVHLHTVWMIVFLKELLMHDLRGARMRQAMAEYVRFEIEGWRLFMRGGWDARQDSPACSPTATRGSAGDGARDGA